MARRKTRPDLVQAKCHLAERLREVRTELFGERGGPEMSRKLNLPVRTWYNYEAGVTVPAEVLLRFVELTGVEPLWLSKGKGPRFRTASRVSTDDDSIAALLRAALSRLEERRALLGNGTRPKSAGSFVPAGRSVPWISTEDVESSDPADSASTTWQDEARREWDVAQREGLRLKVADDSMSPIIEPGGIVVYSGEREEPRRLDGRMVVAWLEQAAPIVRWYQRSGRFVLLRAENPAAEPNTRLLPVDADPNALIIRRVVWISTPRT